MIDGADFRATEIAALFIASGYRLRQNLYVYAQLTSSICQPTTVIPPRMLLSGLQRPPYFCENGAFGAWHYFHELHMNPPSDNPPQTPDRRSSDRFQQHMDERFDALEKLIKSGLPRIFFVNLLPDCASDKAEQDFMIYGKEQI